MIFVTVDYNMMLPSYMEAALLINLDKLQKKVFIFVTGLWANSPWNRALSRT